MKAFLLSDLHLGCHVIEEDKWLNVTKDYFTHFYFPILRNNYQTGDRLYILGDLFDNRSHIGIKVISYAYDIFDELERMGIEVHIMVGNHCLYGERSYEHHSLKLLRGYSNVTVYLEPTLVQHGTKRIVMMPWITEKKEELKQLQKWANCTDYLFCHSDLAGAKTNMKTTLMHGLNIGDFVHFPKVYSGHIHIRQRISNFLFIGSPYQMDRNDKGNRKGVYILDVETGEEEFIQNTHSPEFRTIEIKNEDDIEKLNTIINAPETAKQDWYDLVISNTLLIKNKKLTASLREVTKKTKILSVKQVDDVVTASVDVNVDLDNIGIDLSVEDFMRDYIKTQCAEVETEITDKILQELEDSIRIFYTGK